MCGNLAETMLKRLGIRMYSIGDRCGVAILLQHVGNSCKCLSIVIVGKPYKYSLIADAMM